MRQRLGSFLRSWRDCSHHVDLPLWAVSGRLCCCAAAVGAAVVAAAVAAGGAAVAVADEVLRAAVVGAAAVSIAVVCLLRRRSLLLQAVLLVLWLHWWVFKLAGLRCLLHTNPAPATAVCQLDSLVIFRCHRDTTQSNLRAWRWIQHEPLIGVMTEGLAYLSTAPFLAVQDLQADTTSDCARKKPTRVRSCTIIVQVYHSGLTQNWYDKSLRLHGHRSSYGQLLRVADTPGRFSGFFRVQWVKV